MFSLRDEVDDQNDISYIPIYIFLTRHCIADLMALSKTLYMRKRWCPRLNSFSRNSRAWFNM